MATFTKISQPSTPFFTQQFGTNLSTIIPSSPDRFSAQPYEKTSFHNGRYSRNASPCHPDGSLTLRPKGSRCKTSVDSRFLYSSTHSPGDRKRNLAQTGRQRFSTRSTSESWLSRLEHPSESLVAGSAEISGPHSSKLAHHPIAQIAITQYITIICAIFESLCSLHAKSSQESKLQTHSLSMNSEQTHNEGATVRVPHAHVLSSQSSVEHPSKMDRYADFEHLLVARALGADISSAYQSKTVTPDPSSPPTPDGTGQPHNFQTIAPGLYRSSMPQLGNYETLEGFGLKTIVTLVDKKLTLEYGNFITSSGIIHHVVPIEANKPGRVPTSAVIVHQVMQLMLDPRNYPMLVHCNQGKHRTGCMTACFRKICGWSDEAAIEEYVRYSTPKDRSADKLFIETFDPTPLKSVALERGYVGGVYKQPMGDTNISERSIYTNNSVSTYGTSETGEFLHEYQERIRQENNDIMESARLWSHR